MSKQQKEEKQMIEIRPNFPLGIVAIILICVIVVGGIIGLFYGYKVLKKKQIEEQRMSSDIAVVSELRDSIDETAFKHFTNVDASMAEAKHFVITEDYKEETVKPEELTLHKVQEYQNGLIKVITNESNDLYKTTYNDSGEHLSEGVCAFAFLPQNYTDISYDAITITAKSEGEFDGGAFMLDQVLTYDETGHLVGKKDTLSWTSMSGYFTYTVVYDDFEY